MKIVLKRSLSNSILNELAAEPSTRERDSKMNYVEIFESLKTVVS